MEIVNGETKVKKIKQTVLDQFAHLTNPQEKLRLKSSLNILKYLNQNESDEKEIESKYVLSRIIRGLGSSTSNARTGFYTILVALLNFEEIIVDQIFELIQKHLHTAGSNSKSENADILTGQILASGAIIRSKVWTNATKKDRIKVITAILNACKERTYQGLLAYEFIINSFEEIDEKGFYELCPLLKDIISTPLENHNVDSLYLLSYLKKKFPNLPNNLKSVIKYPEIFSEGEVKKLCNILTIIPRLTTIQHPVYDTIGAEVATSDILNVFLENIDECLDIPNRNKLLVIIKLFTIILEKLQDPFLIPYILTKNFIHQTLNHFKTLKGKDQDVDFKQSINKFFEKLIEAVKHENTEYKTKISILKKLLFSPGTFIFEKITHSKVIQNITWSLNTEGVKNLGQVYRGVIEGTEIVESQYGHGDYWLNNDKLYAAHLLIKLLNHKAMKEESQWKVEQLIFLMELGILKEDKIHVGTELAASLKTAFFGALDLKLPKLVDLHTILYQVVLHLDTKITQENLDTILRNPITPEEYLIWEKAIKTIKKIEKKKKKGGLRSVFLTLFLHLSLLLFNDSKLATDSLNELFACYEQTRKHRKDSDTLDETIIEKTTEDLMWIEVVTDLFLNFLSQNSSLLRTVVNLVFPYLCEHMTPNTIQQLVSVLDPENENPLSKGNSASDEEDSEESDNDSAKEDSDDDDNEEEEEEEDDDGGETVNDKLRMELHKVLTANGYKSDEESIDLDQMSDTEGEKLDEALGKAFKQFRPNHGKRKKQNEDQKTLTHFRVRVLDLIDIYLDSNPSLILTLEIMLPLLKTVEFSIRDEYQRPLLNRLKSCLKKLSNLKKFEDIDGVDNTILSDLLKSLLDKGTKSTWIVQDMGEQITDCCIYVIKCSDLLINAESVPKKVRKRLKNSITEIITNELETYFNKRECVTPILFFKKVQQLSWDGNLSLVPLILRYIFDDNVKIFRKTQAAELATLFYTNQRYLSTKPKEIKEILSENHLEFSDNIITLFKSFCDNSTSKNASEKFICHIFRLLSSMRSGCLNIDNIKWPEVAEVIREYKSTTSFSKDAKSAFNKLCERLHVSNVVKMKPKLNSLKQTAEEKTTENGDKKIKKKKNKEKLKLKKEAKQLRLQSLSEGFRSLDFGASNDIDMELDGDSDENSKNSKKRKHKNSENGEMEDIEENSLKTSKKINLGKVAETEPVLFNGTSKSAKTKKKKIK